MKKVTKPKKCDLCDEKSIITLSYGPHYFCKKHFNAFFENRFRKTVRQNKLFKPKEKLLIALSGGKDSCVLLHLITKYYSKSNSIEAIIIDEGVRGYREKAIKIAISNCVKTSTTYRVITFEEEFGLTNDELMPLLLSNPSLGGTCAFCGTLKRSLINKYAKKLGADKLLTGHNLDDEVQGFVMNVFNNDFNKLRRMIISNHPSEKGFVKRIKPLFKTPEKEVLAYASINNLLTYSKKNCPYSWTAKRSEYRKMLNEFEELFPGTHYSILRFFEELKPFLEEKNSLTKNAGILKKCFGCGEPTTRKYCRSCELIKKIELEKQKNKTKNKNKSKK